MEKGMHEFSTKGFWVVEVWDAVMYIVTDSSISAVQVKYFALVFSPLGTKKHSYPSSMHWLTIKYISKKCVSNIAIDLEGIYIFSWTRAHIFRNWVGILLILDIWALFYYCPLSMNWKTLLLQMLPSKDANFVGYTYKNFEIVNDDEVAGIG